MSSLYLWLRMFGGGAVLAAAFIGLVKFASKFFDRGSVIDFIILVFGIFGFCFAYKDITESVERAEVA